MANPPIVKKKIPPKPQSKQEKKKKGPSKPQPAWLFPPDEENPVLNPKEKSHTEVEKAIKGREKAVDYMQRRVHGVPDRPAPDPLLLTLIGIFLTDFGFNSTSRLFTNERQARQTLNGWEEALGKKIDKKTPKLEQIFRDWHRDWLIKQGDDTSSSESSSDGSGDEESEVEVKTILNGRKSSDEESGSSSAGSDVEMKDAPQLKKATKTKKAKKAASLSPSASSSSSDSDADDEKENAPPKVDSPPKKASKVVAARPTVGDMVNKLKRKAQSSSSESASDASEDERPKKVKKVKTESAVSRAANPPKSSKTAKIKRENAVAAPPSSSEESSASSSDSGTKAKVPTVAAATSSKKTKAASPSSSESDSSDSDSDEVKDNKPQQGATLPALPTASSESSATINGDSKKPSANASPSSNSSSATSSSSEDSNTAPPKTPASTTTKHAEVKKYKGAKPTPLAEKSKAQDADLHPSNRYQSYSYADKAYKDLSVTRGKGFTKEKNKKKRGSYRGGAIDTSGGKAFKFED
jgi:SRP40, C-terminal domain